jgi:predicted nuclease of predicted toxin-antitoxin system
LRTAGHDVRWIAEESPGVPDTAVLERARVDGAPLLTADKDFGELVYRQGLAASGVVLIRLAGLSVVAKVDIVCAAVKDHEREISQAFTVIAPDLVRIRPRA